MDINTDSWCAQALLLETQSLANPVIFSVSFLRAGRQNTCLLGYNDIFLMGKGFSQHLLEVSVAWLWCPALLFQGFSGETSQMASWHCLWARGADGTSMSMHFAQKGVLQVHKTLKLLLADAAGVKQSIFLKQQ